MKWAKAFRRMQIGECMGENPANGETPRDALASSGECCHCAGKDEAMKKVLSFICVMAVSLSLVACGGGFNVFRV